MSEWNLIYQGSVKDIFAKDNELIFKFSDRYSVFDWGAMPDELEEKGKCLALLSDFFFKHLNQTHHGLGLCDQEGGAVNKADRYYKVKAVDVHRPIFREGEYDYSIYQSKPTNCLVPLEVVFRFGIPKGSSLLDRMEAKNYRLELGLDRVYEEGEFLPEPIVEFSTKLEARDRYLTYEEAKTYSGLDTNEFQKLIALAKNSAKKLKDIFSAIDITLWDGKFEFAFAADANESGRDFVFVDSIGPDELRLTYQNMMLSKEFLRQFYRSHPWYLHVKEAQKIASEAGTEDWKKICINEFKSTPPKLDNDYKKAAEMIYLTLTNELYKKHEGVSPIDNCDDFETLLKRYESLK